MRIPFSIVLFLLAASLAPSASAQVLDKRKLLESETFWDNRDWDWYERNIPFFECPDRDIQTTYYYRWELVTKHLTYGSPNSGYSFTEFLDRPFWSGAYGSISCPAGLQLYEVRWLKDRRIAEDYCRYWFRTPGAEPRRYSTWLADAVSAVELAQGDMDFARALLPDLVKNYEGWEQTHFDEKVGLFWQTGHDDGMEININSRQTQDTVRGAPAFRPTLNAYLWADAMAIARIAAAAGDRPTAERFTKKADALKTNLQAKLWDPKRGFFFPMSQRDEHRDGFTVKAGSLTYQTGRHAGDPHGRELIGYVPWQFNMFGKDRVYCSAWLKLMDPKGFQAPYGPTTVERNDPMFQIADYCCVWSGHSWPYATSQTLAAMANYIRSGFCHVGVLDEYAKLLQTFAKTHRKDGRPYIAEGANPDTGSWKGYDSYNHSEHYFHSNFCDLVITGLCGLLPRDDGLEIAPLAPADWPYWALEDAAVRGHRVSVYWDRTGDRYRLGPGLTVVVDGARAAASPTMTPLRVPLAPVKLESAARRANFAVNNDGWRFPHVEASYTGHGTSLGAVNDGNYWYHRRPPNRWTTEGSKSRTEWVGVDFGTPRRIDEVKLYFLDDGDAVKPPKSFRLEGWSDGKWQPMEVVSRAPEQPAGRRANVVRFNPTTLVRLRAVFEVAGAPMGLTEFEAWGDATYPVAPAPSPAGNLAFNPTGKGFPRISASFTSQYDRVQSANDGRYVYRASPNNRWTSYGSPNAEDWLQVDFGKQVVVGRVVLCVYDDKGGVQAPADYRIQYWDGKDWVGVRDVNCIPIQPTGGTANTATFAAAKTERLRVVFIHNNPARSGVTEIEAWKE